MICEYTRLLEFQHISGGQMPIRAPRKIGTCLNLWLPVPRNKLAIKSWMGHLEAQGGDLPTWGSSSPGCNCWRISWSHWFFLRSQAWTDQYCWQQLRPPEIASQEGPGLIVCHIKNSTFSLQLLGVLPKFGDPIKPSSWHSPYLLTPIQTQLYNAGHAFATGTPQSSNGCSWLGFFPGTQEMVIW